MAIQNNFSPISPSLLLDFANVGALDPRITFTRASTATYYGTQTAKAEENLLLQSQTFETTWVVSRSSLTANNETAPDGTATADTLTADGTADFANAITQTTSGFSAAGDKVISVFAKKGTNNFMQIYVGANVNVFANFDLDAGTVGTVGTQCTASIASVGSGWYRCVVITSQTNPSSVAFNIVTSDTAPRAQVGGTSNSIILWGAQLEQRSAVTAYTPTTDQPITTYIPVLESAAAGVARFDHNPTTFESLGLLIEEQRTNLLERSEEFDNGYWTKGNATIAANTVVAPNGTLTGDKFVINDGIGSGSSSFRGADLSKAASPVAYAYSIYAKAGEYNTLRLLPRDVATAANSADVRFNLTDGTVISAVAAGTYTAVSGAITSVGNGWYRCTVLFTTGSETTVRPQVLQLNNNVAVTGDGYSGLYIWGAQLEAGAFPTSYIPTVASQVTRSADAASMTGANFSSWYNQAEGSVYADFQANAVGPASVNQAVFRIIGTTGNSIDIFKRANADASTRFQVFTNNVSSIFTNTGTFTTDPIKIIGSYKVNDFVAVRNGALSSGSATGGVPEVSTMFIGSLSSNSGAINGTIRKLAYYPKRLTNAELQGLTS